MARRRRGQFPKPKQENGQWKIRYWIEQAQMDGSLQRVRKTKCLGIVSEITATQARNEACRFLQPINDCEPGIEHSSKTMQNLIKEWRRAVKPALKLSTQMSYEWAFKRIVSTFGRWPLAAIGRVNIQTFLTASSRQLSGESVRDLRARVRTLFSTAEEWGWLRPGVNPACGKLRLPSREPVRPKRVLTPVQFHRLVAALDQPYRTIVVLAVLTGLRRGELAALRWGDVQQGMLIVDEAVYAGQLGSPKTRKSKREVFIGQMSQKAIEEWRAQAKFTGEDDFMFGIRTNSPIDLHNAVARHLKPAATRTGVPVVSWHDLRHTCATWGRRAGIKPETMRDQLGHTSVLMTLDVYSHAQDVAGEGAMIEQYAWPETRQGVMQ